MHKDREDRNSRKKEVAKLRDHQRKAKTKMRNKMMRTIKKVSNLTWRYLRKRVPKAKVSQILKIRSKRGKHQVSRNKKIVLSLFKDNQIQIYKKERLKNQRWCPKL